MIFDDIENNYKNYECAEIAKIMFGFNEIKSKKKCKKTDCLDMAKQYVQANLANGITAKQVAEKLYLFPRYLYKIF